ncbi:MAG: AAA family ATPase [Sphingorhabdus sp.]
MWLHSLTAENFRQFYQEQKLNFSTVSNSGITVVHGENGAGKTTLLNAFTWALYGQTTFDTDQDNLLNERSISEAEIDGTIPMGVEIKFEHEGNEYTLKRTQQYIKRSGMEVDPVGSAIVELTYTAKDGSFKEVDAAQNAINQILPEKLHSYFFFNGERIEKLANMSASSQISDAIKTIMGLEIIERAIGHLDGPTKSKLRAQSKKSGGGDLEAITKNLEQNSQDQNTKKLELKAQANSFVQYEIDIEEISNRLKAYKESADLQNEETSKQDVINGLKDKISKQKQEISLTISKFGFLGFFDRTASKVYKDLEGRRKKGELPYKIKPQFIDDLIELGNCICGTELHNGNDAHKAIIKYKSNTVPGLEEAFNNTTRDLSQVASERKHMFDNLNRLSLEIAESEHSINSLNDRIAEIQIELSNTARFNETITDLTERKIKLTKLKKECLKRQGVLDYEIRNLEDSEKNLTAEFDKLSEGNEKSQSISEKLKIAEEAKRVFKDIYEILSHETRKDLSERVNDVFKSIIRKPYWAEIDEDYILQIYKEIPNEGKQPVLEKSTGEKQITSLSFISSIISLAKEKEDQNSKFFRGGNYPIIMDSPFGALDDEYRTLVAGGIPKLAGQIILFVTSSQWKGEVEGACANYVGQHLSLVYYGNLDGEPESKYKKASNGYEFTEVEDGYYA